MIQTQSSYELRQDPLEQLAHRLAESHIVTDHPQIRQSLLKRLQSQKALLRAAFRHFANIPKEEVAISSAAEWTLDNILLLQQTLRQISEDMPSGFYRRLPKLGSGPLAGYPRIFDLARELIETSQLQLDMNTIRRFVLLYQDTNDAASLTTGELWALPVMLRLGLIDFLTQALSRITHLPTVPPLPGVELPAPLKDEEIVANCITSLWTLSSQNWQEFFESLSQVEQVLCQDPAGVYPHVDFGTRDRYRGLVEEIAVTTSQREKTVAGKAVELAQQQFAVSTGAGEASEPARAAHVGYYLLEAEGRARLEAALGYHPGGDVRLLRWLRRHALVWYLGGIAALTLLGMLALLGYALLVGGSLASLIAILLLASIPTSALAVGTLNWFVTRTVPPHSWPRLNFQEEGVPAQCRTMVVIPALLASERDVPFLLRQIEHHFLSNSDPNIFFALITDFADALQKEMPGDEEPIAQTRAAIEQLNRKYGSSGYQPFFFFHRERVWNESEDRWMGWERKRGKLEELNELLRGSASTTYQIRVGDLSVLPTIRYVITLDADTVLPREAACQLIGTLAHPLNQAEFDPSSGTIRDGHAILQPRVQVRPAAANQSLFTRVYSGDSVIDLYTRAVSDVYQDLFDEGNFVGKGIYDVDAFRRSLHDKIPENRLLSHDLFEGLQTRCGLVTDIVLYEDYPPHYLIYTDRLHRWVRGDWQLLPWLGSRVPHRGGKDRVRNTLSLLDRWKILDNLRRSLLPPAVLALLLAGLAFLPGSPLVWVLFALSPYLLSMLKNFLADLRQDLPGRQPPTAVTRHQRLAALRSLFEIIFLPHQSVVILDAVLTTLIRSFITHKRMLQWVSSAHTIQLFGKRLLLKSAWQAMIVAPVFAVLFSILLFFLHPLNLLFASPLLLGWIASPYIATRIGTPERKPVRKIIPAQEHKLRLLARSTWLYFEHFVGPEDRWLPPDHFQEDPRGLVAHRTSPTNIGLMLLSTLTAHDLGYIGPLELSLRLRDSFDTMDKLERARGHFLNWYDTRTLAPLPPRYISTVDSGNLAACLMTLRQGCFEMAQTPVINWQGFLDTLGMLSLALVQAHLGKAADKLNAAIASLQEQVEALNDPEQFSPARLAGLLHEGAQRLESMLWQAIQQSEEEYAPEISHTLSVWIDRVRHQLRRIRIDIQVLAPWLLAMATMPPLDQRPGVTPELVEAWNRLVVSLPMHPRLGEIAEVCEQAIRLVQKVMGLLHPNDQAALDWCDTLAYDLGSAQKNSISLLQNFSALASRAESFFQAMKFDFLLDPHLKVFYLGYLVDAQKLDVYHYALLASESQLTSLVAIAKGDVPESHWLHLGRPLTHIDGTRTLLSWSGTMFEYLMPSLLERRYEGTLLQQSDHAAVERQMAFARQAGIPWGISESGYYYLDAAKNYQYGPFGAPGLGIKPRLDWDPVVAPYASLLALSLFPQAVMQNVARLESLRMWGLYGFYEAVDFTADRLKTGETHAIVKSYMVHHQGMIMLSLSNYLFDGRMVKRFHADPRIQTVELLLQEQTPTHVPTEQPPQQQMEAVRNPYAPIPLEPWRVSPDAPYPQLHCLSNGKYSLVITAAGSGFSRWEDIELTRWRDDPTLDDHGSWIYVEDRSNGQLWSVTHQPTMVPPSRSEVNFYPHRVEFERQDGEIVVRMAVSVAPDDDVEIRQVSLTNHSSHSRTLALTTYAEPILTQQSTDQRHPAYNKLFIESEFLEKEQLLLFHRRLRSSEEKPIYLAHFFASDHEEVHLSGYETDREKFLGRGCTTRRPVVFSTPKPSVLSGTTGATLDPVCALQAEVVVPPYHTVQVTFLTLVTRSRKEALDLARRYRRSSQFTRARQEIRRQAQNELAQLDLTSEKVAQIQKLLSPLLYVSNALRAEPAVLTANTLGQPGLWPFAISGDYPILLVRLKSEDELELLAEALLAHTYWRKRGLMIDLVIFNRRETSYYQEFQNKVQRLLEVTASEDWLGKRGGVFIVQEDQMNEAERILLMTVARVVLDGDAGPLEKQLSRLDAAPVRLPRFQPIEARVPQLDTQPDVQRPTGLLFDNGVGGFTPDGREYVIYLDRERWTPAPWVNVIATPRFGCLVSEASLGTTWAENSGENRLTPWRNDPVSDRPSEAVYLRDEDTGQIWSPTPLPARADAPYLVRHGAGYSVFQHASHGLEQELTVFVAPEDPVKVVQLKLHNVTKRMRRINVTYYVEWVLGVGRESTAPYIAPEFDSNNFALLTRNLYSPDFGGRVAFLASTREPTGVTTDRTEFLGELGNYVRPAALERVGLTPLLEVGGDPCAVIQSLLWIQPGETKEITFLLGQGTDHADAERLISHYQDIRNVQAARQAVTELWGDILEQTQVQTPDAGMNLVLNRWLLYQSLSCRFWGRTAFYQSSGAFGFRDQLQDALGYLHVRPNLTRAHILECAAHQFEQGDVLHWWHPPAGRGLLTRCSDNMLWLPYVTAHYVNVTGDRSILTEQIPFLQAEPLKPEEQERYGQFPSGEVATLYEHCCRAFDKGITAGPHEIPLIGANDWNDGLNRVGIQGKGESIWLGWFLSRTLEDFAPICDSMKDRKRAEQYRRKVQDLHRALEKHGWDGAWYLRAYYDDGSPLGSSANEECRIDSIAESWAVISENADPEHASQAMESVYNLLVRPDDRLIALFTPPFQRTPHDPGYIKGYPRGVRENGGQYTHAAIWATWAFAQLGQDQRAMDLFHLLDPVYHADTPEKVNRYRVEPYVIVADIYSVAPFVGRGGWTWYTGSASWMYRLGIEMLLGLQRTGDRLEIHPHIPKDWKEYQINYRFGKTLYHIRVQNQPEAKHKKDKVTMDGKTLANGVIPLSDDGKTHEIVVELVA